MAASGVTSFFQIILNSTFQERKLKIPYKFVHERGNELYGTVRLSIPTGCSWDVKVKREDDGTVWLHDGFLEFMEENSVRIEYFLMFEYEGNSKFTVHIYDLTATEILYSRKCDSERRDVNELQMVDDTDDSSRSESVDEDADDGVAKTSDDSADDFMNNESVDKDSDDGLKLDDFSRSGSSDEDGKKSMMFKDKTRNDGTNASSSGLKKEIIIEPENSSSQNFVKITMKPSYIGKSGLRVPAAFAKLHMPHSTRLIKLVDGENHEWAVRYIHQQKNRALSMGWRQFVQDKKLMAGDVCTFERVLGDEEVKLRVTMSRLGKQHE